jgi:HEAT repeat protein
MRGLALGDTVSVLLKSLKHSNAEVRRSAAASLESFGAEAESAIPVLTQSLSDPDLTTQIAATRALGGIGRAAIPALVQALNNPNKEVRREAIWALARLGTAAKDDLLSLTGALRDSDLRVRLGAAQTLGTIGPDAEAAIPSLIESLRDTNLVFCRLAAQALVRIGPAALPALEQANQSPDNYVRREASWALHHLAHPNSPLDSNQDLGESGPASWARETPTPQSEASPKATVQLPLNPKRIRETIKIPLR